ncbi:hypothetical protein EXIGLDRAFT_840769 [Exidia glandulosa HHB12029]|uniref:Zn(2)-C6 fungal-type domain-containing protein n=1 Tax=Exidia glandulosa HHB12029 TaxID=1314781 RepID=A0A165ZX35_EXIGL|nr:hypothetical protein EXIGLDRAFT_840769 [Exidia glandulosa HHB12029]
MARKRSSKPESQTADGTRSAMEQNAGTSSKRKCLDGEPVPHKRSKTSRTASGPSKQIVCTQCKKRKLQCDLVRPDCHYCRQTGQSCVYLNPPVYEPLPIGDDADMKKLLQRLATKVNELAFATDNEATIPSRPLHSVLARQLLMPSGLYAGSTSVVAHLSHLPVVQGQSSSVSEAPSLDCTFSGELAILPTPQKAFDGALEPLIEQYIDHCMGTFRFVHPGVLRFEASKVPPRSPLALYAAAIALQRASQPSIAEQLYARAGELKRGMEDNDNFVPDLFHIESLLLECHYLMLARSDIQRLRRVVVSGVTLATSLGLHRDPFELGLAGDAVARRRWAFHNMALLDRWVAFLTGSPCILKREDCTTYFPLTVDDCEIGNIVQLQRAALLQLCDILLDVLHPPRFMPLSSCAERIEGFMARLPAGLNAAERAPGLHLFANHICLMIEATNMHVTCTATANMAERMIRLSHYSAKHHSAWEVPWTAHHVFAAGALLTNCAGYMIGVAESVDEALKALNILAGHGQLVAKRAHGFLESIAATSVVHRPRQALVAPVELERYEPSSTASSAHSGPASSHTSGTWIGTSSSVGQQQGLSTSRQPTSALVETTGPTELTGTLGVPRLGNVDWWETSEVYMDDEYLGSTSPAYDPMYWTDATYGSASGM